MDEQKNYYDQGLILFYFVDNPFLLKKIFSEILYYDSFVISIGSIDKPLKICHYLPIGYEWNWL
jgi:hypothetical protein